MEYEEAIESVESILRGLSNGESRVSGKNHYRFIKLHHGLELAVDVFKNRNEQGHIRVHVYNISQDQTTLLDCTNAPLVPGSRSSACPKCRKIPSNFPSWYKGPQANSSRAYYGFQWHEFKGPTQQTLLHIHEASMWLKTVFL